MGKIILDKQEFLLFDENVRAYRDTKIVMEGQYQEGEKKGRAEGRAEGIIEIARKMKLKGTPIDTIAELTELPASTIDQL